MASLSKRRLAAATMDVNVPEKVTYTCPHCMKVLGNSNAFRLHLRVHSLTFKCRECSIELDSYQELNVHRSTAHNVAGLYVCRYCGKGYINKNNKEIHEREKHVTHGHTLKHEIRGSITCPESFCLKVFFDIDAFKLHYRVHGKFRCVDCKKLLNSNKELNTHRSEVHKRVIYECKFCGKGFINKHYMKTSHVRLRCPAEQ